MHLDDRTLLARWFDDIAAAQLEAPEMSCGGVFAEMLVRRGEPQRARELLHRAMPDCERPRGNVLTLLGAARYGTPEDSVRARAQLVAAADSSTEALERHAVALFDAYAAHRAGEHAAAVVHARRRRRLPPFAFSVT